MTLKGYLATMSAATAFCWLGWGYIVTVVDPTDTTWAGFLLFYAALFLALAGTAALAGFAVRYRTLKRQLVFRLVQDAFRQSFLLAFLLVAALFLLSKNLFSWVNLLFLVVGLALIEYFLISYRKQV